MKILNIFIIAIFALLLLTPMVSATNEFLTGSMGATMQDGIVKVSLGIEKVPSISVSKALFYYNWLSISMLFLIGAMSSKRMTRFFAVLVPAFAAMFVWLGWMNSPNPVATWGTIIMCAVLGVVVYMKGSLKENFGGGGPGNLIINITFYLILLQACVGLINSTGMFEHNTQTNIVSADQVTTSQFKQMAPNAELTTSIDKASNSGGILADVLGTGGIIVQMAVSAFLMFINMVISLAAFSLVINGIFPFIGSTTLGAAFLVALQLGIYLVYVLFIFNIFSKPMPDTSAF